MFLPGAIRVQSHQAEVGSAVGPGAPVLAATSATRVVTLDLSASRQDLIRPGQAVSVELPDGSTVAGTVREIGRVATAAQDGTTTVPVTIDLASADAADRYDAAPVTVHVVREARENVLAVPVQALVALLEGGYAVEVVDAAGATHLVAVQTGLYEDGWVEVRGDGLAEGQSVVVAS